ncbi:MAG: DUF4363 family protein [Christensenellales bacterium]|jgi:exo-beta-1,3-glucanase (GH17 family)
MVKKITIAVLLLLMFSGAIIQNIYVSHATSQLIDDIMQVKDTLESDDYTGALFAADTFYANWEKEKRLFEALFEHNEVDIISSTANSLLSYCQSGDKANALAEAASVLFYIEHIRDIDCIGWENIF